MCADDASVHSFRNVRHARECVLLAGLLIPGPGCSFQSISAVLKRDGTNVAVNTACTATSGNWVSPYDGVATTLASDLDIVRFEKVYRVG